jgi:hypothetical protein
MWFRVAHVHLACSKQQEQMLVLDSELTGIKGQIKSQQEQNERLTAIQNKIQTDASFLQRCLETNHVRVSPLPAESGC